MKNRKTRIAIIIEVKKRELPFFSILDEVLKKEGYEVKLIPFRSMCTWRLLKFQPDIILVNGLRTTNPYYYKQIAIPKQFFNSKVVCYYSEQVGYYDKSLASSYRNQLVFDNVDYHVAWGPRFCRDLEKEGVDHSKLWYIGSLQYDIDVFHRDNASSVKDQLSQKFGIDKSKKWVLYADNIIKEYQPKELYEQRRMNSFNVVKKTAEKNPDAVVIFRPHPDTSIEEMNRIKDFFKNNDNIIFNNQEHVYYWTLSSDAVIIWCSTSSIQAMFLNKPVFGFLTSDRQELENYWYKGILPLYDDYDQLALDIHNSFHDVVSEKESQTRKARIEYVKEWYFKKDGLSFNRMVSLIKEVDKSEFKPLYGEGCKVKTRTLLQILYYELRAYMGDMIKGRNSLRNVSSQEIKEEKSKYDFTRYKHIDFETKQSESGKFFE